MELASHSGNTNYCCVLP